MVWDVCSVPTVPPGGVWNYVKKRTGKCTVRPERVVLGFCNEGFGEAEGGFLSDGMCDEVLDVEGGALVWSEG